MLGIDFEKFAALGKKTEPPRIVPTEERKALQRSDLEHWHHWNNNGRQPEDLRPLLNNFRGKIRSAANKYTRNVEIPPSTIHHEAKQLFVHALETYDPNAGSAIGTWVDWHMKKLQRYVNQNQNFARIMGDRGGEVGKYKTAITHLTELHQREPTIHEISDHLSWSVPEVRRMQTELRKSNIASEWEVDPVDLMPSKEREWLTMVYYELTPEEQLVYDYRQGMHGKPQLRPTEIAKIMNTNPSKITRIQQKIAEKIQKYMV